MENNGLTLRQAQILELRLKGYKENDIAEILKLSLSTIYRHLGAPKMQLAMGQIKVISLQSSAISTDTAYNTALELLTTVMMDNALPLDLRVNTALRVGEFTVKAKAGEREQSVIDAFLEQNQPKNVNHEPIQLRDSGLNLDFK